MLLNESTSFSDIVTARFQETYRNLTLKTGLSLYWVSQFCPLATFVVKADDDTVIFPLGIEHMLSAVDRNSDTIYGHVFGTQTPIRNKNSKW